MLDRVSLAHIWNLDCSRTTRILMRQHAHSSSTAPCQSNDKRISNGSRSRNVDPTLIVIHDLAKQCLLQTVEGYEHLPICSRPFVDSIVLSCQLSQYLLGCDQALSHNQLFQRAPDGREDGLGVVAGKVYEGARVDTVDGEDASHAPAPQSGTGRQASALVGWRDNPRRHLK